jgi:hypothetical protein
MEERDKPSQSEFIEPKTSQAPQNGKLRVHPMSYINLPSASPYPVGARKSIK